MKQEKILHIQNIRNLKSRTNKNITEAIEMKKQPKTKGKKLLCPKACVLNQLDDDR